uniref:ABC transporter substrate-binding protein n=1 Tax=Rathayibacter sp. VKM Ac-2630 TaxID=1938617 RepID=UPI0026D5FCCF
MKFTSSALRRTLTVAAAAALAAGSLAACSAPSPGGGGGTSAEGGTAADLDAALEAGGKITYWSWTPSAEAQVAAFEEAYPEVDVELVNAGTNTEEYTKLQNAIKAGSGAPDVVQIEYYAMPQFALSDSLLDLSQYGLGDLEDKFSASTWGSVNVDGKLVGLPQDSGPMAMFYNKTVFDQYGIAVPTTWDEYVAAAEKLHTADPTKYITADTGDAGFATSMIWQAGGQPSSSKAPTSPSTSPTRAPRSGRASGTSSSRRACSRTPPAGETSGTRAWATDRSPR